MTASAAKLFQVRSLYAEGLLAYLQAVRDWPDQDKTATPPYFGGRSLTELYLPPQVYRYEKKRPSPDSYPGQFRDEDDAKGSDEKAKEKERRLVVWDSELPNLNRAVLAGRPGEGKTLLARMSARKIAEAEYRRFADRECEPDELHLPVFVSLPSVQKEGSLEKAVAISLNDLWVKIFPVAHHPNLDKVRPLVVRHILSKLYTEHCTLFLDAVDECKPASLPTDALQTLAHPSTRCRILATGRVHAIANEKDSLRQLFGADMTEYELAPLTPPQCQTFIDGWFKHEPGGDEKKARVSGLLREHPRLNDLTSNAQLLGLYCFAAAREDFKPEEGRAGLFNQITHSLLKSQWKRTVRPANPNTENAESESHQSPQSEESKPTTKTGLPFDPQDLLELTAEVAYRLFVENPEGNQFARTDWNHAAVQALNNQHLPDWGKNQVTDELRLTGLLVEPAPYQLAFLHRSFFEFLTAWHLSKKLRQKPRQSSKADYLLLLDKKAWDPAYKEVFAYIVGLLDNPEPLFNILSDPKKDDRFRHRLELASYCLPEIKPCFKATAGFPEFRERLAKEARDYLDSVLPKEIAGKWWPMGDNLSRFCAASGRWNDIRRLGLGHLKLVIASQEILAVLARGLADPDRDVRRNMAKAVRELGPAAASPEILAALARGIVDPDRDVRLNMAWAVGELGAVAASPEILAALAQSLADLDSYGMPDIMVEAVGNIGAAAAKPELLAALLSGLADPDCKVRSRMAKAVGNIGAAAATPEILAALLRGLADPDMWAREGMAEAVGKIGPTVATPEFLSALARGLADPDWFVVNSMAVAVGNLCPAAATQEILVALARGLKNSDRHVQYSMTEAVGKLGTAVATPEFVTALARGLVDPNEDVRKFMAVAVGKLGTAAATPTILATLLKGLKDPVWDVRLKMAEAMGKLGEVAATPEILAALAQGLADLDWEVRLKMAKMVGRLCSAAVTAEFLAVLARGLTCENHDERELVAKAVGRIGAAAATSEILTALARGLTAPDKWGREGMANTVGAIGAAAATPEFLTALMWGLADSNKDVRRNMAKAVGKLGSVAATPEILVALSRGLVDPDKDVRRNMAETVSKLGPTATTTEILAALAHGLADQDDYVRNRMAWAINRLHEFNLRIFTKPERLLFWRQRTIYFTQTTTQLSACDPQLD